MKKKEFKEQLKQLLQNKVEDLSIDEKIYFVKKILTDFQIEIDNSRIPENKGEKWTDAQIALVLSYPATKENCLKLAQVFGRGYGSIEQIYRWASTPKNKLSEDRKNNMFIQQIYRVKNNLELKN